MHELGVIAEVVKTVEDIVREQGLTEVEALVLQIGELSSIIPRYVEDCYPAVVDGTLLEKTRLEIEILPANGRCRCCGKVFHIKSAGGLCPDCHIEDWELLGGREFLIKEILAC